MEQRIKFSRSHKVYLPGTLFPNIRVGMRKVEQVPSVSFEGEEKVVTPNAEVFVYDTSGPFSDPDIQVDLKKGLTACVKSGSWAEATWSSCRKSLPTTDG